MILTELGPYLAARRAASLDELARHFRIEREALRGMLDVLVRKGRIARLDQCCPGCGGCAGEGQDLYAWTGGTPSPSPNRPPIAPLA